MLCADVRPCILVLQAGPLQAGGAFRSGLPAAPDAVAGTFEVSYAVVDAQGNVGRAQRTLVVSTAKASGGGGGSGGGSGGSDGGSGTDAGVPIAIVLVLLVELPKHVIHSLIGLWFESCLSVSARSCVHATGEYGNTEQLPV